MSQSNLAALRSCAVGYCRYCDVTVPTRPRLGPRAEHLLTILSLGMWRFLWGHVPDWLELPTHRCLHCGHPVRVHRVFR